MKRDPSLRIEDAHQHHCPTCGKDWNCWCWNGVSGSERQCLECIVEAGKPKVKRVNGFRQSKLFSNITISEGGWVGRRWMTTRELRAAVKRWVEHSYETGENQPGHDDWVEWQCGGCRYFGALDSDYGVCCNPTSPNDGRITFEHGGCVAHSELEAKVELIRRLLRKMYCDCCGEDDVIETCPDCGRSLCSCCWGDRSLTHCRDCKEAEKG